MSTSSERDAIQRELASFLTERGVRTKHRHEVALTPEKQRKAESIAKQIVCSGFDKNVMTSLDKSLLGEVSVIVHDLMSSRLPDSARELEEINPYYTPFNSKTIFDSD